MGPSTPRLCSAPRTNVVLPAPSSPETSTTSPGLSVAASSAPARSVASALGDRTAQGEARAQQRRTGEREQSGVDAGVGELAAARGALRGGGGGGGRRGRRHGLCGRRRSLRRRGRGGRRRLREGVLVLLVSRTLGERCGRDHEREQQGGEHDRQPHRARQSIPRYRAARMAQPCHILVLTDRDWTHPQGGGTGTNLYGQVSRWVAWGHRVTVVAGTYPGAVEREELAENLTVHRMGSRLTVFPRAAWACLRDGVGADADVTLEVVNGITFLTPLWLRRPRVALVHHVHRDMYVAELGRRGAVAALVAETLPLRSLYRDTTVLTISDAGREDLLELGLPQDRIHVA